VAFVYQNTSDVVVHKIAIAETQGGLLWLLPKFVVMKLVTTPSKVRRSYIGLLNRLKIKIIN